MVMVLPWHVKVSQKPQQFSMNIEKFSASRAGAAAVSKLVAGVQCMEEADLQSLAAATAILP